MIKPKSKELSHMVYLVSQNNCVACDVRDFISATFRGEWGEYEVKFERYTHWFTPNEYDILMKVIANLGGTLIEEKTKGD